MALIVHVHMYIVTSTCVYTCGMHHYYVCDFHPLCRSVQCGLQLSAESGGGSGRHRQDADCCGLSSHRSQPPHTHSLEGKITCV